MLRLLTRSMVLLCLVVAGAETARAFSLHGPPGDGGNADGYQQPVIGYMIGDDNGAPKQLGDEYRWNTPELYYTVDAAFLDYFGSNGLVAVEGAMGIYNSLTNLSAYSPTLSEFPLEAARVNYRARAANLIDLKTAVLTIMTEEMGLGQVDRWTWCLRSRIAITTCPDMQYTVIRRNFDPVTWQDSSYVNGTLYTYFIEEICTGPDPLADAVEFPVDPLATVNTAISTRGANTYGTFASGLTRDDVGALRYMWGTNNINWELASPDSLQYLTNTQPELLFTTNLQFLAEASVTNDAAALQALFPGLIVTSTSNYFVNVVQTNITAYFTNFPFDPVGTPPRQAFATNLTPVIETRFVHTYQNVITNTFYPYAIEAILTTNIAPKPTSPAGSGISVTNITIQKYTNFNTVSGSFYLLPDNACDLEILYPQITNVVTYTNFLTNTFVSATNSFTNATGSNVVDYYEFSQSELFYFTNVTYVARVVQCPTNVPTLRQGMDGIAFIRRDYDSLLGRFYEPITNNYYLTAVTNNQVIRERFQRVVTQPDFLITAENQNTDTGGEFGFRTEPNFDASQIVDPGKDAGPGTLSGPIQISLNKVGPLLVNTATTLDWDTAITNYIWGSFDDSTNAPVVYPVGSDLQTIENLIVIRITQPTTVGASGELVLPNAQLSLPTAYSFQLEAVGGALPYTWSRSPGSAALPDGLSLSSSGLISGMPAEAGTFDFSVRLTDAGARYIDRPFTITVLP